MILNVNIDHVATLRNARGGVEPDVLEAARIAVLAGAKGIVLHLREDRRHIKDNDVYLVREKIDSRLDLEMAANDEIIHIALDLAPDLVTIVPEKRNELTTEGGLDVKSQIAKLTSICEKMISKSIAVSFFVDPVYEQILASKECGADMVEIHTGHYANLQNIEEMKKDLAIISDAVQYAHSLGLKVAAGHGLNYQNTQLIAQIPNIHELSIGHSIISRSIYIGLHNAVREMLEIIRHNSI
jgi:pyridoxine 5-phosphate synthase